MTYLQDLFSFHAECRNTVIKPLKFWQIWENAQGKKCKMKAIENKHQFFERLWVTYSNKITYISQNQATWRLWKQTKATTISIICLKQNLKTNGFEFFTVDYMALFWLPHLIRRIIQVLLSCIVNFFWHKIVETRSNVFTRKPKRKNEFHELVCWIISRYL